MSRRVGLLLLTLALASCGDTYEPGSFGEFRFIGRVRGQPPLSVIPPISDRRGNVYTAYGAIGLPETVAFASRTAGSSRQACTETKGDTFGLHGWVGFADDRAWYWSGDALVRVSGDGGCGRILNVDPATNADLQFKAVMPWVRITGTRNTLVALVQSAGDVVPFSVLVDLERNLMTNVLAIPGRGPVTILGVGAEPGGDDRVTLVARGGAMEALFFDEEANLTETTAVAGTPPPEYGVLGYLRMNERGTVVGLTSVGSLVVFNRGGGGLVPLPDGFTPVGVHLWNDAFYVVGTSGDRPAVIPVDAVGQPGAPVAWEASETAAANLSGPIVVNDDRTFPVRETTWVDVKSAMGAAPFLSPFSPWPHSNGTTLWVVAGPVSDPGSGRPLTSIAIVPVGIAYP